MCHGCELNLAKRIKDEADKADYLNGSHDGTLDWA